MQHLSDAGEGDAVWVTAEALIVSLRDKGRYREALAWVERVLATEPTGFQLSSALMFRVQLEGMAGFLSGDAEEALLKALELGRLEDRGFCLHELGRLAQLRGELSKARQHLTAAVEAKTAQFGDNWDTSISLHALASVLRDQGDLDGAKRNFERSLQIESQVFGTCIHPNVAASLAALASVLRDQGDLDGAKRDLERSLQINAQVFGTDIHPDVAASLHQLASVLQAQGDLNGARKIYERSIEINENVHETREHYSRAITETNLALLLQQQGETQAATDLLAHAYSVFLKQLGPDHPHTRYLASLLKTVQKVGEPRLPARRLRKTLHAIRLWLRRLL